MRNAARNLRFMLVTTLVFGSALGCSSRSQLSLTNAGTQLRTPVQTIVVCEFGNSEGVTVPPEIVKAVTAAITNKLTASEKFRDSQIYSGNPKVDVAGIEVGGTYTLFTEGSAFARFMAIGCGKGRLEAEVRIVDRKTKQVLASGQVKTSTTWGGIAGAITTAKDLVEPFAWEAERLVSEYKGQL